MTSHQPGARARLQTVIPANAREAWYRIAAAIVMGLSAFGVLNGETVALWGQLAVATITLLFAALYATTPLRVALYAVLAPLGAVLLYYGITYDEQWAIITASIGQAFGIATAAAKTVQSPLSPTAGTVAAA